ncbi:hypothetical protein E4U57_000833 [Claviceps arundinis]|uniref:Ubiquitination network signaling protein n=1 Tax=Claviceps arundinis TaxID=1623583 RepID=A0ABQ7PBX7_9HYPO|nr:hypothetical protein E4U57_000833 [Claviceps arundinis]
MPRASGSGKRQQGATTAHRDFKHENGLVSPVKRGSARKSNGQLDGSARSLDQVVGHAGPSSSPSPIPGQRNASLSKDASDAADGTSGNPRRRPSLGTYSEASSESAHSHAGLNGAAVDAEHRQIDVNAMKNLDVHKDSGILEFAATVIKSLPMQDTLAILIILMHIPYMSLSLIYACFALITFVPPVTTKTGINLAELLDGNAHNPSLVTIFCMDFFFFLIWVFLWQPIQDGILEFAKPVIAISLGGGTNAKDGTSRGVTTCFTWILLHQALRATESHWAKFTRHFPASWPLSTFLSESFESFESKPTAYDKRSTHGWIQSTLAMHILTQGIVRFVREWYLKREKANAAAGAADTDANKSSSAGTSTGTTTGASTNGSHSLDAGHDANSNAAETEPSTSHTTSTTTTASSSKRRRKQSAQVRLEQPLWAAFASSKIVAIKEFELSQWGRNPNASNATDRHNLGSASFDSQPRQIWISYIGSDEVCFNTSFFPHQPEHDLPPASASVDGESDMMRPAGVDASKPFYVRINNAFWQPTRIIAVQETDDDETNGTRWTGDIYGLRPAATYVCEFVDIQSGEVIHSTTIRTANEALRENDSLPAAVSAPGQPPLRPDSPATIIRNSIAAEETRLADERARLKAWRKEAKTKLNTIRREIELVDNQLSSAGSSDERHRQKIRQHEIQKIQAERDIESLGEQLDKLNSSPELVERKRELDKLYAEETKQFEAAQKQFDEYTSNLDREVKAKELETVNLKSRRNKIGLRIDKVDKELRNIADANRRGLGEADRRDQERATWLENSTAIKSNYMERISQACNANASRTQQIQNLQTQLSTLNNNNNNSNNNNNHNNNAFMAPSPAAMSNHLDVVAAEVDHHPGHMAFRQHASSAWNATPARLNPYPTGIWAGTGSSGDGISSVGSPLPPAHSAPSSAPAPAPVLPPPPPPSSSSLPPTTTTTTQPGCGGSTTSSASLWQPPPTAPPFEPRGHKSRGRSSSMLSNVSGFTEPSGDEDSFLKSPPSRPGMNYFRRNGMGVGVGLGTGTGTGTGASGSGGSTGSGSVGDARSPR